MMKYAGIQTSPLQQPGMWVNLQRKLCPIPDKRPMRIPMQMPKFPTAAAATAL